MLQYASCGFSLSEAIHKDFIPTNIKVHQLNMHVQYPLQSLIIDVLQSLIPFHYKIFMYQYLIFGFILILDTAQDDFTKTKANFVDS